MRALLLDVGGTFIKGAVLKGTVPFPVLEGEFQVKTDSFSDRDAIKASLSEAFAKGGDVLQVAVAIPGPFDFTRGVFLMKHKFASVYGESFRGLAGIPDDIPVSFIHDVNCMLEGELAYGAAKGEENVALVTLGTGLGFTVATEGKVLKAPSLSPAVGIWNLPYEGGILEDYVSARGIASLYGKDMAVKDIATNARNVDGKAAEAFSKAGAILAGAIAPILREYSVERLLFGGQISRSFDLFEKALQPLLEDCPSLRNIGPVSDISRATFLGLAASLAEV